MNEHDRIIPSGPFKGKKIEFAPTTGVDLLTEISEEFMQKIFGLEPGDYFISDESSLRDFTGLDDGVLNDIRQKIQQTYDLDVSDIPSGNLLERFTRVHRRKYGSAA